jgi:hypothetical protein
MYSPTLPTNLLLLPQFEVDHLGPPPAQSGVAERVDLTATADCDEDKEETTSSFPHLSHFGLIRDAQAARVIA